MRKKQTAITLELLEAAYCEGIFPMGNAETGEIEWYQPDPRTIIDLERFHVPRRLAKTIRSGRFTPTLDRAFDDVIRACSREEGEEGVWITAEIMDLYRAWHRAGRAHSLEVWEGETLAGGLYGVALGGAFMGESMFHCRRDASKAALVFLVEHLKRQGFVLLDTQFPTAHLAQFGIALIPHTEYRRRLRAALALSPEFAPGAADNLSAPSLIKPEMQTNCSTAQKGIP